MRGRMFGLCLVLPTAMLFALAGCGGGGGGGDAGETIAGHNQNMKGVMHADGFNNPLVNCVSCHGADLKGGSAGSCYACHNDSDHTVVHSNVKHRAGVRSSCVVCHGPNNTGGLGPACTECH